MLDEIKGIHNNSLLTLKRGGATTPYVVQKMMSHLRGQQDALAPPPCGSCT